MTTCVTCHGVSIGTKDAFIEKWTAKRKQSPEAIKLTTGINAVKSEIDPNYWPCASCKKHNGLDERQCSGCGQTVICHECYDAGFERQVTTIGEDICDTCLQNPNEECGGCDQMVSFDAVRLQRLVDRFLEEHHLVRGDADAADDDDDSDDEVCVEPWTYKGTTYLIDPMTNIVYNYDTQEQVGTKDAKGKFIPE